MSGLHEVYFRLGNLEFGRAPWALILSLLLLSGAICHYEGFPACSSLDVRDAFSCGLLTTHFRTEVPFLLFDWYHLIPSY